MKNKFKFNDKEDFRRLERLTYDGTLDYSDFPPPEYKYFAERQKKSLLIEYRKYLENFTNAVQTYRNYQDNIKISEMLKTEIQKSHDTHDIAVTAVQADDA